MLESLQVVERVAYEGPIVDARIGEAVTAHLQWRVKFRAAIYTGKLHVPLEMIRRADACPLGRWLDDIELTGHVEHAEIRKRHAEFHEVAARVAELVLGGRSEDAHRALETTGAFGLASHSLLETLWGMV